MSECGVPSRFEFDFLRHLRRLRSTESRRPRPLDPSDRLGQTGCRTSRLDAEPAIRKDGRSMTLADSADMVLPIGFVVGGRYRLDACLGSGGMGTVYAARAVSDGRP